MFQPDYYERAEEWAKAMEDVKSWKDGSKSFGRESKDFEESVDESAKSGVISNVSEFNAKCLGTGRKSVASRKSEVGERTDREKKSSESSSYGSCTCCSSKSSSSSNRSPIGTVCRCSSSGSSKSSRSGESARLRNCTCK